MAEAETETETGNPPDPLILSGDLHEHAPEPAEEPRRAPEGRRRYRDRALGFRLFLVLLAFSIIAAGFSLRLKAISLPILAVAEIEERLNWMSALVLPGTRISLGGIDMMLNKNWSPVFRLQDVRLLQNNGSATFVELPATSMTLDGQALLGGRVLPRNITISGAHLDLKRDLQGRINLSFGQGNAPAINSLAELFDGVDNALELPELAELKTVEFEGLSLTMFDERLGHALDLGDGRLVAENRPNDLAAELEISVLGETHGRARMTAISQKGAGFARVRVEVNDVQASDLAGQHPVLAWLAALDAPISGQLSVDLGRGGIDGLDGTLSLGAGALQPSKNATPIAFTKAGLKLSYDRAQGRLRLIDLSVESKSLRASAQGRIFMLDDAGQILKGSLTGRSPSAFLGQLTLNDVQMDPEGLFETPLKFAYGALDMRLTPDPFLVEIGQFTLSDGDQRLTVSGQASAAEAGWTAAFDMAMNRVSVAKLIQLWPVTLVPRTRDWTERNLLTGDLTDVNGAIRLAPGTEPVLHLDYEFADTEIRVMPTMPPIQGGVGYSVIDGNTNTTLLTKGTLTPPEGGVIDLTGSSMKVLDIYAIPAIAQVSLRGAGPAVAMLSILDQKPFEYLKKAGRPVALGQGMATARVEVRTPLAKAQPEDIDFSAEVEVTGFTTSLIVEGREIALPVMRIKADKTGITAGGRGTIDGLPFDAVYSQPFLADAGPAKVTGTVEISPRAVETFDLGLPKGMIRGTSSGRVAITIPKIGAPQLSLTADLQGTSVAIPELGWAKSAGAQAKLEVEARLSSPPSVSRLSFSGAGLSAQGSVAFRANGRLDTARFDRVILGGWLDGAVEIKGTNPLAFAVTSGAIDFRKFPSSEQRDTSGGASAAGSPLVLRLSEFRVTDSIRLNGFRGDFILGSAGVKGQFSAQLGGTVPITGGVLPETNGIGVRVVTSDAGAALKAAGLFDSAAGGSADLYLSPSTQSGVYSGRAKLANFRVKNDNILADLLNAISVVGLLEQLNGSGIVFNQAEGDFVLTPDQVSISRSSAIGASMGVSLEGTYQTATGRIRMGGVLSPIYLLNGVGAILTRKGEGLFGFTFRLDGTADVPKILVNPLSILTPGMFREIFRRPPPKETGATE